MRLRNRNPLGDVDVPLIGRQGDRVTDDDGVVIRGHLVTGEEFECTHEQAAILLQQVDNYEPADDEAAQLAADIAGDEPGDEPTGTSPSEKKTGRAGSKKGEGQ